MSRKLICLLTLLVATPALAEGPAFISGGKLQACVDPTFPPMEFMADAADKEPSGVDIDVGRALAALD